MTIRYAIVGIGYHAKGAVIPALQAAKHCQLTAACDVNQDNLAKIKDESVAQFSDYSSMLAVGGFDVVYVATLEELHHEMVIAALKAGYHVLCEKPLGMSARECEEMLSAAQEADKHLAVGFELRYHPEYQQIRTWIRDSRLGKIEAVHMNHLWDAHKAFGNLAARRAAHLDRSGSLDCGIHKLDIIRYLTGGGHWQNVAARGRWVGEVDRKQMPHISVMADLDNGVLATLNESYSYCANINQNSRSSGLSIVGDRGVIHWASDGKNALTLSLTTEDGVETFEFSDLHHAHAIVGMVDDFAAVITGEIDWPETLANGEDGLIAQRIIDESLEQTHQFDQTN